METQPQGPIDGHMLPVEREYWVMNWINGAVVFSPQQADIYYNGLEICTFAKYPTVRYYDAADEIDEVIASLAKIKRGDRGSALRFIRTHGLLGRSSLLTNRMRLIPTPKPGVKLDEDEKFFWAVTKSIDRLWSVANSGDPLWWLDAHARTIRWCLAITSILESKLNNEEFFQKGIDIPLQGIEPPWIAIRDDIKDYGVTWDTNDPHGLWNGVQRLCDRIVTENISGMRRTQETGEDGKVRSRFGFKCLIEMVYWRLADIREGGSVQQCSAQDCHSFFIQTDPRQRYCPPGRDERESKCSRRDRMHRYRSDPKFREGEKKNQRRRYHEQKEAKSRRQ